MARTPYTLLALCGASPQVITETVWSLATQPPHRVPSAVHVLTTALGAAHVRARLLGVPARDPARGTSIPTGDHWASLCDYLELDDVPLELHVPEDSVSPLLDIQGRHHDEVFADYCYDLVHHLTQDDDPLIGSLSGGRKTMSAHVMTAFAVHARANDTLVHVLVQPAKLERKDFYFPTTATPDARITRIDIPFPRLRHLLPGDWPHDDGAPTTLKHLREVIEPHLATEQEPTDLHLTFVPDGLDLRLINGDTELAFCHLTPQRAANFTVLAEAIAVGGGRVERDTLLAESRKLADRHLAHSQRTFVAGHCNHDPFEPWTFPGDVSKAISRLTKALEDAPALHQYLELETTEAADGEICYNWAQGHVDYTNWHWRSTSPVVGTWPFTHLAEPTWIKT
ncbi:MAG: TIGR02584 family CRISPR-associated protein [Bacteroidetes bacterium]|jgi:CRISPR-associated protein (TIGR02584 family)|nr:TIGR02584 family CRISPR-associated protein [Bacteroidota bacterium]